MSCVIPFIRCGFCLFLLPKIGHDIGMAQFTRLRDFYAFPGFTPESTVRGVFGDPYAAVITLRRRPQKHSADNAGQLIVRSTIKPFDGFATTIAVDAASTSSSPSVELNVASATP